VDSSIVARGKKRPRKTVGQTIKKDFVLNDLSSDIIYDNILWHQLINIPIMANGFGFCNVSNASREISFFSNMAYL
jgi:hypothetical protein